MTCLAALIWLLPLPRLQAFSLEGYITSTFADLYPERDHWAWPKDTITYSFYPGFSTSFTDPLLKDQVRLAFQQWATINARSRGVIYSFSRWTGGRGFVDIRSVALHEVGHILGLHHPDQAAPSGYNFTPSGGSYVSAPATSREVMNSSLGTGSYNRLLSFDELDGYAFIYGLRDLTFVEVPSDTYADISIYTFVDPDPIVLARGAPDTLAFPCFICPGPIPATFGRLKFSTASSFPMGIQSLGMIWRIKSTTGKATRSITVQTAGTDNPAPLAFANNSSSPGANQFDSFLTSTLPGIASENEFHTWSSPHSGPIPATESIAVGLELDVWDWTVASVRVEDESGGLTGSYALLSSTSWYNTNTSFSASSAASPDGVTYAKGFQIVATGLKLQPSAACVVHDLALADVSGMNLTLADLTPATLSNLQAQQRVEPIQAFGQRNLGAQEPFVLAFQGGVNNLPPDLAQSGNFLILNRPDLEDKELLIFARSDTADATSELYALISKKVIGSAPAICVTTTEVETNDTFETATYLGLARNAIVAGTIGHTNDVDFVSFEAPYGARIWATVDTGGLASPAGTSRDSILTIYGITGTDVLEVDDDDGTGNGGDSTTESEFASAIAGLRTRNSGTHYVGIRAYDSQSTIMPYALFLTITTETNSLGPEVEPNDGPDVADTILPPGQFAGVRSAAIGNPGDVDYYAVNVPAGPYALHISVDGDPERDDIGTDVAVDLLASDGTTVLFSADSSASGGPGNPPAEGFNFVLPSDAANVPPGGYRTFYVRVRGANPNAIGTYDVMVAACRLAAPELAASRSEGQIQLRGPLHALGFRLMTSSQVSGPWQDAGLGPAIINNHYSWSFSPGPSNQFFRLMSP